MGFALLRGERSRYTIMVVVCLTGRIDRDRITTNSHGKRKIMALQDHFDQTSLQITVNVIDFKLKEEVWLIDESFKR
jgi:hypothetical protein